MPTARQELKMGESMEVTSLQTEIIGRFKGRDDWTRGQEDRKSLHRQRWSPYQKVISILTSPGWGMSPESFPPDSWLQRHEPKPERRGHKTFGSVWFGWSQKSNMEPLTFQGDFPGYVPKHSVHPGSIHICSSWTSRACWCALHPCTCQQWPELPSQLFSQVLFGNSVWGLGTAGSFWVIAYPGGGGRPSTTACPQDPWQGSVGNQVRWLLRVEFQPWGWSLKLSPEAETAVPTTQSKAPQSPTTPKGHLLLQGNVGILNAY